MTRISLLVSTGLSALRSIDSHPTVEALCRLRHREDRITPPLRSKYLQRFIGLGHGLARSLGHLPRSCFMVCVLLGAGLLAPVASHAQAYYVFPGNSVYGPIGAQSTALAWCVAALNLENAAVNRTIPLIAATIQGPGANRTGAWKW